jgi:plasmid stabilization system protein ParE
VADVRFHPEADEEYRDALAWYRARSPQAADRFEAAVETALGRIAASPMMFPIYDDQHRYTTLGRCPYSIVYRIQPDCIFVVAVAHAARRSGYWQGRA